MTRQEIPYKIYLTESKMPQYWYNLRADMKNKPAPLLNPGTHQPMTAEELSGVFCEELVQQELDNDTREYPVPQEILDFYKMYRPSPLVRVHPKSLMKAKAKLHELTRRNQGRNVRQVMEKQKLFMQGWLNYYGLADMKSTAEKLDQWLRRRYRMYIWKQWKKPQTRYRNLRELGVPEKHARMTAGSRQSYWAASDFSAVKRAITKERLERAGYFNISKAYESIHETCILRTVVHTM